MSIGEMCSRFHWFLISGALLVFFVLGGGVVYAGEIQYAGVREVRGSEMYVQYRSPGEDRYFVCDAVSAVCGAIEQQERDIKEEVVEEFSLFPDIGIPEENVLYSRKSSDGVYMLVKTAVPPVLNTQCPCEAAEVGMKEYLHTLYDVSGDTATMKAVLPYTGDTVRYKFASAGGHIGLFGKDGTVTIYEIATGKMRVINPGKSGFSYQVLSPHGTYLAAYHSADRQHLIWDTTTGDAIAIPAEPSGFFMDFSYDETMVAYIDDREGDGEKTVYIMNLTGAMKTGTVTIKRVFEDDFVIDDYLFLPDNSFYVRGNQPDERYQWVLYQHNPLTKESRVVAEDVSYGGYLKQVDGNVQFQIIEGKNTHIALYSPETDEVRVIRAVEDSPASEHITREVIIDDNGVHSVLYKPKNRSRGETNLFVWLHGGPMRQTSLGYHPYLSYAVYDELLEKFADAGAYVLKVDFAGSYGYGKKFQESLVGTLGALDAEHVVDATKKIQKRYRSIDNTYLIGNSYGGYLGPKVLVDHQKYFDGAITVNGVFDWLIWLEEHPSADSFKKWFNGMPNFDPVSGNLDLFTQASILKGVPELKKTKPMLLIYGEDDTTILPSQTREFYYFAKSLDKDARLLAIPDEGHIIKERKNIDTMCVFITGELKLDEVVCESDI